MDWLNVLVSANRIWSFINALFFSPCFKLAPNNGGIPERSPPMLLVSSKVLACSMVEGQPCRWQLDSGGPAPSLAMTLFRSLYNARWRRYRGVNQIGIGRYYVPRAQTLPTSINRTFLPSVAREYKKVRFICYNIILIELFEPTIRKPPSLELLRFLLEQQQFHRLFCFPLGLRLRGKGKNALGCRVGDRTYSVNSNNSSAISTLILLRSR